MKCRISFSQKIYASYAALLIFAVSIGAFAVSTLRNVIRNKDLLAYEYAQDLVDVDSLHVASEKMVAAARGYFLTGDDQFLARMEANRDEMLAHFDSLRANKSTHNQEDIESFGKAEKDYEHWTGEIIARKKTSLSSDAVQAKFEADLQPRRMALEASLERIIKTNQIFLRMEKLHSAQTSAHAVNLMIEIVAFFLSLAIGIALVTARMLRNLYDESRDEVRLREDIVSVVAHDLRTPLTALMLRTQVLLQGLIGDGPGAEIKRALEANLVTGRRMDQLIHDLLDLAKIRAGEFSLQCSTCDVSKPIQAALTVIQPFLSQKSISIHVDAYDSKFKLECDCDRVIQILQNLLSNAIKFSPIGSDIFVTTTKKDSFIAISIEDHGSGIPPDQIRTIFDRFKQARKSDSKLGTGLGLTIAKEMAEAHGGTIGVESVPGHGSKFTFTIPASNAA